jgi:PAS domain S-box-containing protein
MDLKTLKYKFVNSACKAIFGYTPEERIQHTLPEIYPPESAEFATNLIKAKLQEYKETGIEPEAQYEIQQYHKDGHLI